MRWIDMNYQICTLHKEFQFFRQYLFWTVSDRPFLSRLLLYLLYQFSEHIIVHITLIIILVVSLLSLSRNKTNSQFLNTISQSEASIVFTISEDSAEDLLKHQHVWNSLFEFTNNKKNEKWYKAVTHEILTQR